MTTRTFLAAGFVAASMATAAFAGDVVTASEPTSLGTFFFDQGIASKLSNDSYGDPMVQFRKDNHQYTVFFYGCTDNTDCTNLQFYIGYETNGDVGMDVVNKMNQDNRFVVASIDDQNDVILTMDVFTGTNGLTNDDFKLLFDVFLESVADFEDRVGWVSD
jgi:hypothetical protein